MYKGLKKSRMDWPLFSVIALLLIIGTLAIFSATVALPYSHRVIRTHLIALPIASIAFLIGWGLNYQIFQDQWKMLYGIIIIAMTGVLVFGVADRGAMSWYRLPFFSVQPSEICRVGLVLILASYLDRRAGKIKKFSTILGALALAAPVFLLTIKQPDFSSIMVTFPIILAMFFCAGVSLFHLSAILSCGFLSVLFPILWTLISLHPEWTQNSAVVNLFAGLSGFGLPVIVFLIGAGAVFYFVWWIFIQFRTRIPGAYFAGAFLVVTLGLISGIVIQHQMKEYQRKRLEVFLSPTADPRGAGYNLLQAKIAMGSGGMWGKGIFSGTQGRLGFVPERHTDFILAVVGEEMGFWGSTMVLGLYLFMLWRILLCAKVSRDQFGYLVNCGIFSMFGVYMFMNFGMSVGLLPVIGVPLPLVSYGGSNLVATMWALGIVESVYSRRYALV